MNCGLKHSRRVKEGCEMAVLSLRHHLSSCWKCNTYDSVAHISWRYIKMSQLCGSFIKPANVILITSSISTHMSQTNAGTECFFFSSFFHPSSSIASPTDFYPITSSSPASLPFFFFFFFLSHISIWLEYFVWSALISTHTWQEGGIPVQKKKKSGRGESNCVCAHTRAV